MEYKLIKKYPVSPDLGFIASPKSHGDYYVNSNWIYPEKYPEFWEKVVELDYEILRSCPIEGSIYSVKRISDGEVFTVGDNLNFNNEGNGVLLRIDFERALADKGTGTLCFANDNGFLGDWWSIRDLIKVIEPIFTTHDNIDISGNERLFIVSKDLTLGVGLNFTISDLKDSHCLFFAKKENAEKYIEDNKPKRLYTEDEMVRALENWGMCRVDISYVNEFLNK